jgi:hypothetical protein
MWKGDSRRKRLIVSFRLHDSFATVGMGNGLHEISLLQNYLILFISPLQTPLYCAVEVGHIKCVRELITANADLDIPDVREEKRRERHEKTTRNDDGLRKGRMTDSD